jgi:hypothetical protein
MLGSAAALGIVAGVVMLMLGLDAGIIPLLVGVAHFLLLLWLMNRSLARAVRRLRSGVGSQ